MGGGDLCGGRERRRTGDVERAGADAALLSAAVQDRHGRDAAGEHERAHPHRTRHLVRGEAHRVDAQCGEVQGDLTQCLHRVGVDGYPVRMRERDDLLDRLHRPDLVVREHDGDQAHRFRVLVDRRPQCLEIDAPLAVDRQPDHVDAVGLEVLSGFEDRVVLDRGDQQSRPVGPTRVPCGVDALEREVVRLRPRR